MANKKRIMTEFASENSMIQANIDTTQNSKIIMFFAPRAMRERRRHRTTTSKPQMRFSYPQLPEYLQRVQIRNLRVGNGVVDLDLHRHPRDVGVNIVRKEGDVEVAVLM